MKNNEIYNLWNEFINNDRYKKYFDLDEIRDWKNNLDDLKKFIDENNARPLPRNNKKLHIWQSRNITISKNRLHIMKYDEIYNLWNEFINDNKYKQYFISPDDKWKQTLKYVKKYIDENNKKPSKNYKINSDFINIGDWINKQLQNYKKKTNIISNTELYALWTEFIYHEQYKQYFT